jgi:phosphoribosylglycinamide formyltransferase-1
MALEKLNLAVFISGRGSNMKSIVAACKDPDFPFRVCLVLSNRPDAAGLLYAQSENIPTAVVDHKSFNTREDFETKVQQTLSAYPVNLIALAGFLRVLTAGFIAHWPGRIINIHPSLLPDYKGLDTHARAIADGQKQAGCTVHYVVPAIDSGKIIIQRAVPILPEDNPDTLAARVLEQEHIAYPEALRMVAEKLRRRT